MEIHDGLSQFWDELTSRPAGPMAMRFVLQPLVASAFAIRDGIKDARINRAPYLMTVIRRPKSRRQHLREGLSAVSRVLILAIVFDLIYQIVELQGLRPLQTTVIALFLAFIPYLIVR